MQYSRIFRVLAVAVFGLASFGAHAGQIRTVTSPAQLEAAVASAQGGLRIDLAEGDYGMLSLRRLHMPDAAPLTLRSADPARPARFSGLDLRDVANLVIEGVVFDYTFRPGDPLRLRPFDVRGARNLAIRETLFDGDVFRGGKPDDNGYGSGFGLSVRDSVSVTLENSEIRGFFKGFVMSQSRDLIVRGNDLYTMRMDGMNFAEVRQVRIENNRIHDFRRSPDSKDHADMIQFWTKGTHSPSSDVTIRGNLLHSGAGLYTQSIFIRNQEVDQGRAGTEMFYRDFTIERNVIVNAHLHGITVGETRGLTVRHNTVVRNAGSEGPKKNKSLWTPMIRIAETSRDVSIERNVVAKIVGFARQPDWRVGNNFMVQDDAPLRPGFYGAVFTNDPADPGGFGYRKGGPLDSAGIGAPQLQRH